MSVRKIKNSWYVDFYDTNRVRRRLRSPENSRAGAVAYEATLRHKLVRGEAVRQPARPRLTFAEAAERWLQTYVAVNTKPSVQQEYRSFLKNHLVPMFGPRLLTSITAFDLERFKAACREKGLAPKSTNNGLAIASRLFRDSHAWEWIEKVPKTDWLKVPPQPFDFLTPEELPAFLADHRQSRWGDMILCGLRTGMRLGELLALRWEAVDLDRRVITISRNITRGQEVSPKSNKIRHVPMTSDLAAALADRKLNGEQYVFGEGGGPITAPMAGSGLMRECRRTGFRRIGWHVLRHTFASHLAMRGVPLHVIQKLMGHASIQTTMRYAHLVPSTLFAAVNVLTSPLAPEALWASNGHSTPNHQVHGVALERGRRPDSLPTAYEKTHPLMGPFVGRGDRD